MPLSATAAPSSILHFAVPIEFQLSTSLAVEQRDPAGFEERSGAEKRCAGRTGDSQDADHKRSLPSTPHHDWVSRQWNRVLRGPQLVDKILEHLDCSLITHDETPIVNKKVVIENRVAYRISLKHETQPIEGERGLPDEI